MLDNKKYIGVYRFITLLNIIKKVIKVVIINKISLITKVSGLLPPL
jgi:hypothetical protein